MREQAVLASKVAEVSLLSSVLQPFAVLGQARAAGKKSRPVEYRLLTHISMKSKETARINPTLIMPPAPPCMLKVLTGARGMSQNWLKMPLSSVEQSNCGVHGQPFGALPIKSDSQLSGFGPSSENLHPTRVPWNRERPTKCRFPLIKVYVMKRTYFGEISIVPLNNKSCLKSIPLIES